MTQSIITENSSFVQIHNKLTTISQQNDVFAKLCEMKTNDEIFLYTILMSYTDWHHSDKI